MDVDYSVGDCWWSKDERRKVNELSEYLDGFEAPVEITVPEEIVRREGKKRGSFAATLVWPC